MTDQPPLPALKHSVLNVPSGDTAESKIARHYELLLDLIAQLSHEAEGLNMSQAQGMYDKLYDAAIDRSREDMGYDVQISAAFGGDGD